MSERDRTMNPAEGGLGGYETRDITPRAVALFGAGLAVALIAALLATYVFFAALERYHADRQTADSPLAHRREIPAAPRLQVDGSRELRELRAAEEEALSGYAWIDEKNGIVRIPIERAIDLLVKRGLPVRAQAPKGGREQK